MIGFIVMVILVLVLLGLCLGSFVNALVWRTHEQSKTKNREIKEELSVLRGRSMCVNCRHDLTWHDLLPVVSWLMLGGKCRYCRKPISRQYPAVELVTMLLFVFSYLVWPYGFSGVGLWQFGFWLAFLTGFVALAVYDLRWKLLPNSIVLPLTILAAVYVLAYAVLTNDAVVIVEAILGMASIGGLFYILFQASGGKWIGGGDVKLGFALGLLAGGLLEGLMVIFVASLLGTVFAVLAVGLNKQALKKRIPFGPFLITALVIVYLFGADIINWYQQQIFLV
jgi:leader peptidase (prepilin peptidase)/N-methyltransferase